MHELALIEGVVDYVIERIDERVVRVTLEVGELAGVDVDALQFCFGACTEDTLLAGAELAIERIAGRARCRRCGREEAARSLFAACTCGSFDRELVTGSELRLKHVEVL